MLKFIGEEYSGSTGFKKLVDQVQDFNASTGLGGVDLGFRDSKTHLPTLGFPQTWRMGSFPIRAATQLDLLFNDVGPANINVGSAAKLSGITSPADINRMAKYLTTDEGTVDFATRFVMQAQADLAPLIKGMDARTQTQIIVDYVRRGGDDFWNENVMPKRKLDAKQLQAWKQAPDTFIGPNGTTPDPLMPNSVNFIPAQFQQIDKVMQHSSE